MRSVPRFAALFALSALACAGPLHEEEEVEHHAAATPASTASKADEADDARTRELERKVADATFEAAEIGHRLEQLALEHEGQRAEEELALHRAKVELELAQEALERFVQQTRPRRVEEEALSVRSAQDSLLEQREELAQLELMYSGAELGEATAEIVMERARRSLARAETRAALSERRSLEVLEGELPAEQARLELELMSRELALVKAERARQLGELARAASLRKLDHEKQGATHTLEDLARQMEELDDGEQAARSEELAPGADAASARLASRP